MGTRNNLKRKYFQEELQCSVCLDSSVTPIHGCTNGHIICGVCAKRLKNCATCKKPMSPNSFADQLVKKYDIKLKCKHNEAGCKEMIRGDQMIEHMSTCGYRPIQCFWGRDREKNIGESSFELKDYYNHLLNAHSATERQLLSNDSVVITARICKDIVNRDYSGRYNLICFHFGDYQFIVNSEIDKGFLFWWITVLGGKKEASQFKYGTSIAQDNPKNEISFNWELPVLPVHGHTSLKDVLNTGKFAMCSLKALVQFTFLRLDDTSSDDTNSDTTSYYGFGVELEMFRTYDDDDDDDDDEKDDEKDDENDDEKNDEEDDEEDVEDDDDDDPSYAVSGLV